MLALIPRWPRQAFIRHEPVYADDDIGRRELQTTGGAFELGWNGIGGN